MKYQLFHLMIWAFYKFNLGIDDLKEEEIFLFREQFDFALAGGLAHASGGFISIRNFPGAAGLLRWSGL
jgi:hypothetical protein